MTKKYMKRWSTYLIIKEMRSHLTPVRVLSNSHSVSKNMEKREHVGGNVNWYSPWKSVWRFLKKLKTELPYDPAITHLGISKGNKITVSKRYLFSHSLQHYPQ